jgi:hypothetical protein
MDREGFSKRLAHALDLNHVGRAAISDWRHLGCPRRRRSPRTGRRLSHPPRIKTSSISRAVHARRRFRLKKIGTNSSISS